eukprot:803190_1
MAQTQCVDLNLWSFIRNTQATQLASLKVLQKFILSLNKTELSHIINCYLRSKVSKYASFKATGLTFKQTEDQWANEEPDNEKLEVIDRHIISKLNAKYATKYQKKVIAKTTQQKNKTNCNRHHVLSIPPQVLAYSFQFLSFKELCKIQHVCVHFMYLNKRYPALTHHYFALGTKFCQKAMRFKVRLSNLCFFKHIHINSLYCDVDSSFVYSRNTERRHKLFKYLLKTIIMQSKSHLDTLAINAPHTPIIRNEALDRPPFGILLYIMNECAPLAITKLFWTQDYFKPSTECQIADMLQHIRSQFVNSFPKLTILSLGRHKYFARSNQHSNSWATEHFITSPMWKENIFSPIIHGYGSVLQSLDITSFACHDFHVIQLVAKHMINLKTLAISFILKPDLPEHTINIDMNAVTNNLSLNQLKIRWTLGRGTEPRTEPNVNCGTNVLMYLFDTFSGITEFQHDGAPRNELFDWYAVLNRLIETKRMYSMKNEHELLPLESLKFNKIPYADGQSIMKALLDLEYCGLKHFAICFDRHWRQPQVADSSKIVPNDYFAPFLQLYQPAKLKTVNFHLPGVYDYTTMTRRVCLQNQLNILSNIPASVTSMCLNLSPYSEMNEVESIQLVKKLCDILLETQRNQELKLENITLKQLRIAAPAKKYLLFWFGFNNKISIVKDRFANTFYLQFR